MKKLGLFFYFLLATSAIYAQWTADKGHSKIGFTVSHHGISEVDGYFKKFDATITAVKPDLSDAVFELNIETPSINTDLEMRDSHLKSEDLFNVEKFPTLTFKSTSFKKIAGNKYKLEGNLTMKGITKPMSLDVTMNGPVPNPNKQANNMQLGIKALGKLKRSDFGIGGKLETAFVSDEVELRLTGEFSKPN